MLDKNQEALKGLEAREYDKALRLFQEAVDESRNVESLTNLAWFYVYEEGDYDRALELVKEAVHRFNPTSHFPYNLLGEIYLYQEKWQDAANILKHSLNIHLSSEGKNNLAVANYHLGYLDEAERLFLEVAAPSDYAFYSHIKCLIGLGRLTEAQNRLNKFSEQDDEFVGEVHVAELYYELECDWEAIEWYEKGWDVYYRSPDWVQFFVHALFRANQATRANEIIHACIQQKNEEILNAENDHEFNEFWTESDQQQYIEQLHLDKKKYELMTHIINSGASASSPTFSTSIKTSCYLFGCRTHSHPNYPVEEKP